LIRGGYIEGRAGYDHHHAGKLILQRVKLGIAPRSILLHKATNTGIGHQEEQRKKSGNDNARDNRDYTTHNGCPWRALNDVGYLENFKTFEDQIDA
jgi:hypothetical protein